MSHDHEALRRKIRALHRTRDQLELMILSGPANAQDLWGELEKRWSHLENHAEHLTRESEDALDGVADVVRENITELREGYERVASALRETHPDSLWGQVRNTLGRLVEGGHRATERAVGSVEELGDATKVRMKKARLERARFRKCAELGTQVCDLAKGPGRPEGGPPQVLDDEQVKALLQDLSSLDADLRNAAEFLEPDRIEA
jgi:hypothetical protein